MTASAVDRTWLRTFVPAPRASARLVCFPHAGGSAAFFLPTSRALAPRVEVISVQYPGRQDRRHEPCIDDIGELAAQVSGTLVGLEPKPTFLFGHSMGATLAFETARVLGHTTPVEHLFVSGRRAPSVVRHDTVHLLDDAGLLAEVAKLGGTDQRILDDAELLRMALPAIRSDYRAAETYRYSGGAPLDCSITAFAGLSDPGTSVEEVREWRRHTRASFDVHELSGDHFFLVDHAMRIHEAITAVIDSSSVG
ncbi:thioesterase [Pseudonocardia sp. ICBG1122]|nr:thioesterase [Pseudonocardia pini]